jgi:hypothetical protein
MQTAYEAGKKQRDEGLPCHVPQEWHNPENWKDYVKGWHYKPLTIEDAFSIASKQLDAINR